MKRAGGKSITERVKEIERELDLHVPEPFRLVEGEDLPLEREDVAEYREAINSITDIEGLRIVAQRLVTAARNQAHQNRLAREAAAVAAKKTAQLEADLVVTRKSADEMATFRATAMERAAERCRAQATLRWLKAPWWRRVLGWVPE